MTDTAAQSVVRAPDNGHVSFIELFYDLVFVFTIIQLSHTLAYHYTPIGALETLVLILAVWWGWIYTTWVTNWLNPDSGPVRGMLFVLMFLGLIVSTSIPEAYGDKGLFFAFDFVGIQVGRSVYTAFLLKGCGHSNARDFMRIAVWMSAAGVFWVGGAFLDGEARLIAWIIALAIEYSAAIVGFWTPGLGRSKAADWKVNGAHMAERCALFIIICIGETILVSGRVFSETAVTAASLAAFAVGFLKTLVLWWIYFRFGRARAAHVMTHSDQTGALARLAFTYAHIPIVVGIIVSAVGTEFLLAHPYDPASWKEVTALTGGPAIYLVGTLLFKRAVSGRWPLSHGAGVVLLAAIAIAGQALTPILIGVLAVLALIIAATMEWASERRLSSTATTD